MPASNAMSRDTFLYLAVKAGLDTSSPHMDELYQYVQNVLSSLQGLNEIDISGAEPEMAFIPPQE